MAAMDELIDQLGGAGPVGVVIAAAVLAPAVFPPVRRSLRGLAKVAIVQYLRVTEPRALAAPGRDETLAAGGAPSPGRRGRAAVPAEAPRPAERGRRGTAAAAAPPAAPAPAPRGRRAQPAPSAAAPAPARPIEPPAPVPRDEAAPVGGPQPQGGQVPTRTTAPGGAADGLVNLNTATRGQLTRLPRVGAQTADRIIEFREQQGPIRNLRQLRQADVISVAAARQIRDLVLF